MFCVPHQSAAGWSDWSLFGEFQKHFPQFLVVVMGVVSLTVKPNSADPLDENQSVH